MLGVRNLDGSLLGCRACHVGELAGGGGHGQTLHKLLFEVGKALVAYEILFRGERNKFSSLALAAEELGVLGGGELDKTGEVVLAVELEERLESGETREVEGLCRLKCLDLGSLTLKNNLVLLVTGAER